MTDRQFFKLSKEEQKKFTELTFEILFKIITQYNIPHNVHLMSDSGWECDATDMMGIFYNEEDNILVFTQDFDYWNDENSYFRYNEGHISYDGKIYKRLILEELKDE